MSFFLIVERGWYRFNTAVSGERLGVRLAVVLKLPYRRDGDIAMKNSSRRWDDVLHSVVFYA